MVLIGILAIILGFNIWKSTNYINNKLNISEINLSTVEDGEYTGEYNTALISAKVRVTVENQQITGIEIMRHNNGRGSPAESIIEKVLDKQSLKVDTVSGATLSSKVILKALEESLKK